MYQAISELELFALVRPIVYINNQYFASKVTLCCLCFGRSNLLFLNSKQNIYRLVDSGKYFLLELLILSVIIFITSKVVYSLMGRVSPDNMRRYFYWTRGRNC